MIDISVIICSHNPRANYLKRVLDALKGQTLPQVQWELLLVDNASKESLALAFDLSWHPNARHIREEELGLTPARFRGIKEARSELLIFVDDDNVLDSDYLATAYELSRSRPGVGAMGGNISGEFETEPEYWVKPLYGCLALVEVKNESWACLPKARAYGFIPCGAGMIIRKKVATNYVELATADPLRRNLGRKGASLASCEDGDMALCACALGYAIGHFPQLRLSHLIPSTRLERNYLLRLVEEMTTSSTILQILWNEALPDKIEPPSRSERLFESYKAMRMRLRNGKKDPIKDEIANAGKRGTLKAIQICEQHFANLKKTQSEI